MAGSGRPLKAAPVRPEERVPPVEIAYRSLTGNDVAGTVAGKPTMEMKRRGSTLNDG